MSSISTEMAMLSASSASSIAAGSGMISTARMPSTAKASSASGGMRASVDAAAALRGVMPKQATEELEVLLDR